MMGFPQGIKALSLSCTTHAFKTRTEPELPTSDWGFVDTLCECGVTGLIHGNSSATAQVAEGNGAGGAWADPEVPPLPQQQDMGTAALGATRQAEMATAAG